MTDIHDDIVRNPRVAATDPADTFDDILRRRFSRRAAIGGSIGVAAALALGAPTVDATGAGKKNGRPWWPSKPRPLGFESIPPSTLDEIVVPAGYRAEAIIPWGDPIQPGRGPAYRPDASNTAADQAEQLGMGHDGIRYFPLGGGNGGNRRGLLALNHEYTIDELLFPDGLADWDAEKTRKSQHAHGVSIVEVQRRGDRWQQRRSTYARRIHVNTPMQMSGPVAGHPLVQTPADPTGTAPTGTANNCGNGYTPWGTYLTCEENFNGYFAASGEFVADENQARLGVTAAGFGYPWYTTDPRFDLSDPASTNEPNTFGWIVEIDPYRPDSTPVKRSALGRFKHEGAAFATGRNGEAVVYMGDDERFDYIYRFVGARPWKTEIAQGRSPLDEGTLYVARFDADGTGEWLPLVHGVGPLTAENGFADQAEVLVKARLAGDALGATPMDRPEWTTVAPNGDCFVTLTNNTRRTPEQADAPNPRGPNPWGHIIRWRDRDTHTGSGFDWDVLLLAGPGDGVDGSTIPADQAFGSPDGLWADDSGLLWIQTDGSQPEGANDQMLVTDPATGQLKRFLTGVIDCEVTGVTMTPDRTTMFVNIQHPGDDNGTSTWPTGTPGARPRPATVVITRDDGGVIGT